MDRKLIIICWWLVVVVVDDGERVAAGFAIIRFGL